MKTEGNQLNQLNLWVSIQRMQVTLALPRRVHIGRSFCIACIRKRAFTHTYLAGQKESGDANGTILRRALNRVSHGHSPEISDATAPFAPEISDGDTSKWRMGASGKCPPPVGAWPFISQAPLDTL